MYVYVNCLQIFFNFKKFFLQNLKFRKHFYNNGDPALFPFIPHGPTNEPQNTRRGAIIPGLAYPAPAASVLAEAEMAGPVDKTVLVSNKSRKGFPQI